MGCLPIRASPVARGMQIPNVCVICGEAEESSTHLFLKCQYAIDYWRYAHVDPPPPEFSSLGDGVWKLLEVEDGNLMNRRSVIL